MAVTGSYLATDARRAQRAIEIFKDHAVGDMASLYADLEKRADKFADDEFERLDAEPVGEDCNVDTGAWLKPRMKRDWHSMRP